MSATQINSIPISLAQMKSHDECLFTGRLDEVAAMSSILHELHHTDEQSILMITSDGIRLITAGEKTFQVSAFFAADTFQKYKFNGQNRSSVHFRFALKDFIECLNLLRDEPIVDGLDKMQLAEESHSNDTIKTSLCLQYRKHGEPLLLKLENKSNYVINCGLSGYTRPHDSRFCPLAFTEGEETAVIVLNSKRFYDFVSGIDLTASDYVSLDMARGDVPLKICTRSTSVSEIQLAITSNETDIIKKEIVVSDNCLFSFSYKSQFMKPALDGLRTSLLVKITCGSSGLLCIEHFHGAGGDRNMRDGPFKRPAIREQEVGDMLSEFDQGQNRRSSVEYFILSEAKPIDGCPDYNFY